MVSGKVIIKNPTGLHLRPAGLKITIEKATRTGELTANAKSVLSILGACIKSGDEITIVCDGEDEEKALDEMIAIVQAGLGE